MRTQEYDYVLQRAAELTGRVYSALTTEEATLFRGSIAQALRKAWELYPWPETLAYSKEFFGELYSSSTTFSAGDFVYWGQTDKYYQALKSTSGVDPTNSSGVLNSNRWIEADNSITGNDWSSTTTYSVGTVVKYHPTESIYAVHTTPPVGTVPTNTSYFGEVQTFVRTFDKYYTKDGNARPIDMGEVFGCYKTDPRTSFKVTEVDYEVLGDTVLVRSSVNYVWAYYRTIPPILDTDPSTIPYRFSEYCSTYAASRMLFRDGKLDQASALDNQANDLIMQECDKVNTQEGQVMGTRVFSR